MSCTNATMSCMHAQCMQFTKSTPDNKFAAQEFSATCQQNAAIFLQEAGQRLKLKQFCINTAIVYMRKYCASIHRCCSPTVCIYNLSAAALFLATKHEEHPLKLGHIVQGSHICLNKDNPPLKVKSKLYEDKVAVLRSCENVLLQVLGFDLEMQHPHTYVVQVCHRLKASEEFSETCYFLATASLHMTTMCLQYRPTVVACVCIHLACKWFCWKIEPNHHGKEWFEYVDESVTPDLLATLGQEFLNILESKHSPESFKEGRKVAVENVKKSSARDTQTEIHEEHKNRHDVKDKSFKMPLDRTYAKCCVIGDLGCF